MAPRTKNVQLENVVQQLKRRLGSENEASTEEKRRKRMPVSPQLEQIQYWVLIRSDNIEMPTLLFGTRNVHDRQQLKGSLGRGQAMHQVNVFLDGRLEQCRKRVPPMCGRKRRKRRYTPRIMIEYQKV